MHYSAVEYSVVHYNIVQYSVVHLSAMQYSVAHYSVVHYSVVYHPVVHYSTVQCSAVQLVAAVVEGTRWEDSGSRPLLPSTLATLEWLLLLLIRHTLDVLFLTHFYENH